MQHLLTPYSNTPSLFAYWQNAFNEDELNFLQQNAKNAKQTANVGSGGKSVTNENIRRSQIYWMSKNNDTAWLFEKLSHIVSSLNAQFFKFDLTGFGENLQLTHYDQLEHGMYGWHQDFYSSDTGAVSRKLSLVLQLSDPSEYEGGNLQLFSGGEPITIKKQRGLVVAFPSYVVHQVTPITQGTRQSLVAWITGPSFR